jgi:hypothetical protein
MINLFNGLYVSKFVEKIILAWKDKSSRIREDEPSAL